MMEIERPKIETASLSPDGRYGRFVAEPLERGFGITLGNSLRRVLLFLSARCRRDQRQDRRRGSRVLHH